MVPFAYKQYRGLSLPQLQIVNSQFSIVNYQFNRYYLRKQVFFEANYFNAQDEN